MTNNILGANVDLSEVESDGLRWHGHVVLMVDGETVTGTWCGANGSDMGELHDIEGADEVLCEAVEAYAGEIESAIADLLGDPRDAEAIRMGEIEREIEAAINEQIMRAA